MSRATTCFPISLAQPPIPAPPPPSPDMQPAKDAAAVPAAVAPTEVSYTAYSPTPSSIALHMRGMNRIDKWRQDAPTKRSSTPSPDKVKTLGRSLGEDLVGSRMTFGKAVGVGSAVWSEARPEAGTPNVAEGGHGETQLGVQRRSGEDHRSSDEPSESKGSRRGRPSHLKPPDAVDPAAAHIKDQRPSCQPNARDISPDPRRSPSRLAFKRPTASPRQSQTRHTQSTASAKPSRSGHASTRRSSEENRRPTTSSPREPKDQRHTSPPVVLANPTHRHLQPLPRPAISPAPSALDAAATGHASRRQRSGAGTTLQTRFEARLYPLPDSVATGLASPASPAAGLLRTPSPRSDALAPPLPPKQPQPQGVPVSHAGLDRTPSTRGAAPAEARNLQPALDRSENALPPVPPAQPLRINHDGLSFDVQPDPRGRVQISIHWPRRGDWRSRKRRERDRIQKLDRDSDDETWPLSTEMTNTSAAGDTTLSPRPGGGARSRFDRFRDSLLMPRMRREPITRMPQPTFRQLPPAPQPPPPQPMSPFRPPMRYPSPLPSPMPSAPMGHGPMWHMPAPPPQSPRPGERPYPDPSRPEYGHASQPTFAGGVPTWQQARPQPPQAHDPYLTAYPQPFGGHVPPQAPPLLAPMPQHYPPQPVQVPPRGPHYTMPPRQISADHLHPAWRPSLFPSASMRSRVRSPSSLASFDPPSSAGSIGAHHHRMRSAPDMLMRQPMEAYPARQRSPSVERWLRESQQQARGPLQNERRQPRQFFGQDPNGGGMFRRFFGTTGGPPGRGGPSPQSQAQSNRDPRASGRRRPPFKLPVWSNPNQKPFLGRVNLFARPNGTGPAPPKMPQPPRQRTFWGRLFTLPGGGGGNRLPTAATRQRQSGRQAPAGRFPLTAAASAAPQRMREMRDRLKDERRAAKTARRDARAAARMR